MGFSLDSKPPYQLIRDHYRQFWKIRGGLCSLIILCSSFKFSRNEEMLRVLELDPFIIKGMPFIITPWSVMMEKTKEHVLSISVWAPFLPYTVRFQPTIGL